jgi:dTDP-4-dehydrorhamnose reductase
LQPVLASLGSVVAARRADADLADTAAVRRLIRSVQPSMIVNAAAYTAVDRAEEDRGAAHRVNAVAPGVMAEEAERAGAGLVHYSTDYVFDGTADRPYRPSDPTNPQSVYGQTKREGEERVAEACAAHWILRTSWLYGPGGDHFVGTMRRLAEGRDVVQVVDDQFGSPTSALWLAEATGTMLETIRHAPDIAATAGTYHAVAHGQTSWYGFARAIFQVFGIDVEVEPVGTDAFPRPAPRPAYSVLDATRFRERFDVSIPSWSRQLMDASVQL